MTTSSMSHTYVIRVTTTRQNRDQIRPMMHACKVAALYAEPVKQNCRPVHCSECYCADTVSAFKLGKLLMHVIAISACKWQHS